MQKVHFNYADLYFPKPLALHGLSVLTYGHEKPPAGYDINDMLRQIWVLHYVVSGTGTFNGKYSFTAPCGFLMTPYESQRITVAPDSPPFEHYWVEFHGESAEDLLRDAGFETSSTLFRECDYNRIFDVFTNITAQTPSLSVNADFTAVSSFFELLSLHSDKNRQNPPRQESVYASKLRSFIHENYQKQISAADIAAAARISPKYAARLFKSEYGVSPVHYLNQYRIQCAQTILQHGPVAINELAESVGIPDPSYFCKLFRKFSSGLSPSQFAKKADSNIRLS